MDANNTAQPELSFQHKAVQAFHMQRAQEKMSVTNLGHDPSVVAAGSTPPSTSPLKCNIDTSGSVEPSKDEGIDDHPGPHMFLFV